MKTTETHPVVSRGPFCIIGRSQKAGVTAYTKADLPIYIEVSGPKRGRNSPPERLPVSYEALDIAIIWANGDLNAKDFPRNFPLRIRHFGRTILGASIVSQIKEPPWGNLSFCKDELGITAILEYNTRLTTDQLSLRANAANLQPYPPLPVNPNWPANRSYTRLLELGGKDMVDHLQEGDIWFEIGPGKASGLYGYNGNVNIEKAGVNLHGYETPPGIKVLYGWVPFSEIVCAVYGRRAKLVTDFYAAVSYHDDPIAALVYEASLLGPGGKAVIVTEVERFGDPSTWKNIKRFINNQGQNIKFEIFETFADANQAVEKALRITIEGQGLPMFSTRMAECIPFMFGIPKKTKILWQSPDGAATIWRVDYTG